MQKYSFKKTTLDRLFQPLTHLSNESIGNSFTVPSPSEREFVPVTGFHIYCDIRLKLSITAGDEDRDSQRYLNIMQDCTTAAEQCAEIAGVRLLEVQTDKLHFIIESPIANDASIGRMLAFCTAFTKRVFEQVMPRDPGAWKGFAMAVDHGPAIIVNPRWDTSDSFVSLGVAANTPAKRLYEEPTVETGRVAINENMRRPDNNDQKPKWKNILVYSKTTPTEIHLDADLDLRMFNALTNRLSESHGGNLIKLSIANEFLRSQAGGVKSPARVQGFYKRADIDGFTAAVKAAFAEKTDEAIEKLLLAFFEAMSVPVKFKDLMAKRQIEIYQLPWAGDCANMIVFPPASQTYQASRLQIPFAVSLAWQEMEVTAPRKWAVAVGGGGNEESEGANGALLIARVQAGQRSFLLAAGWGSQRSHDAQQSDGLRGTETALHKNDVDALEETLRKPFKGEGIFRKATLAEMKKAQEENTRALGRSKPITVAGVTAKIPAARPHFDGNV